MSGDFLTQQFTHLITATLGIRLRKQEQPGLCRKILARVSALGLPSPEAYYRLLTSSHQPAICAAEWQEFVRLLTTPESYFFRDQGQFCLLKNYCLPDLMSRKQTVKTEHSKTLRIWSAGCSTGEEAYSLAILIQEQISADQPWNIVVLGTDINQSALEQAKTGIYSEWSFRSIPPEIKAKYFRPHRQDWELDPNIRSMVTFQPGNLVQDKYPNPDSDIHDLDLILCRNVFIYFDEAAIAQVLNKFYRALAPQGYLMTGHTELYGQNVSQFQVKSYPESVVYQRMEAAMSGSEPVLTHPALASPASQPAMITLQSLILAHRTPQVTAIAPSLAEDKTVNFKLKPLPHQSAPSLVSQAAPPLVDLIGEIATLSDRKAHAAVIHKAKQLIAQEPQHFKAYCLMAEAYANLGDYRNATQACEKALQLDPLTVEPFYLLAQIAQEQGDIDGAKRMLKRVIYLLPTAAYAYFELGTLYEQEGNVTKAEKNWRSTLEVLKQIPATTLVNLRKSLTAADLQAYVGQRLKKRA